MSSETRVQPHELSQHHKPGLIPQLPELHRCLCVPPALELDKGLVSNTSQPPPGPRALGIRGLRLLALKAGGEQNGLQQTQTRCSQPPASVTQPRSVRLCMTCRGWGEAWPSCRWAQAGEVLYTPASDVNSLLTSVKLYHASTPTQTPCQRNVVQTENLICTHSASQGKNHPGKRPSPALAKKQKVQREGRWGAAGL